MATITPKTAAVRTDEVIDETQDTVRKLTSEAPAQVREFAEKSVQQAKEGYARFKSAAEEASDAFEEAYATATKGYKELGRKSVEVTRSNVNAHFDFLQALIGAKSVSQAVELQTSYARQQFDVVSGQIKDLSALAQKAAADGSRPFQDFAAKGVRYTQSN